MQGLLAYFYKRVAPPSLSAMLDFCRYNRMLTHRFNCSGVAIDEVFSTHFTVCQKPWTCRPVASTMCHELHAVWWDVRSSLERSCGLEPHPRCVDRSGRIRRRPYARLLPRLIQASPSPLASSGQLTSKWSNQTTAWPKSRCLRQARPHASPGGLPTS